MPDSQVQLETVLAELQQLPHSVPDMVCRINLCRQALSLLPRAQDKRLWSKLQHELGTCLSQLPTGDRSENIEQAIVAFQNALQVRTQNATPTEWAQTMHNLAAAYTERNFGDRAENIELAIAAYHKALKVRTHETMPIKWAMTLSNLGDAYLKRIIGERAENIEQAIVVSSQALTVRTKETMPTAWAATMLNLANAYSNRIDGERAENIERAIAIYKQAAEVQTRETSPEDWADIMNNLAVAHTNRILGVRAENIEIAIDTFKKALEVRNRQDLPSKWAETMNNLAVTYRNRIHGERAENIEQAISIYQQALEVQNMQAMPIAWAETMNNLAITYMERIRGTKAENIEWAIAAYENALKTQTRTAMPMAWATTTNNLAAALAMRVYGKQEENIEKAIIAYKQALKAITRQSSPLEWAGIMNNLANAYLNRIHGQRAKNIDRAINTYEQALQVRTRHTMPVEWAATMNNLGAAYANRIHGNKVESINRAIGFYRQALTIRTVDIFPSDHRQTQSNLGRLLFNERRWDEALVAYQGAIDAGNQLLEAAYTEVGRHSEVSETAQLYTRAVYCFWQLSQPATALHYLEQGKTRLLSQTLALGDINLAQLSPAQQKSIQALRQTIHELGGEMRLPLDTPARRDDRQLANLLRNARAQLSQQIESTRDEYPDFMPTSLDVADILALIPSNGVLIAPCVTSQGSIIFIVPSGVSEVATEHILSLPDLNTDFLSELLFREPKDTVPLSGWLGAYGDFLDEPDKTTQDAWVQTINNVTNQLWSALMGPVHQRLQILNLSDGAPVLMMPQGGLGLLPLHAAWRLVDGQPRYFCDEYTVTYAPSAYTLRISCQRTAQPERQTFSLFATVNPTGNLNYTPIEGEAIRHLFPSGKQMMLHEADATASTFSSSVQGYSYVHYAGHGYYHWRDPIQSGLQLADKTYTLSDILSDLELSSCRLVTLSACETGITEFQNAPDEYVGLPAGFLQAGAPAVISTLWAVNDLSTMLLMEHFYRLHLRDGQEFAPALRQAQLWLRDVTTGELASRFGHEAQQLMIRMTKEEALAHWYRFEQMDDGERPFFHPYYWAAFTFTGA